ncbi:hypothetical protein J007_06451 [Cryptococcus neoformans]|nr:hypothetical protein J007_06451 [Cryptococcus neoformans var. grubii]OXC58039.1 hypothetical protein C358_06546 [Cryptococcus neoformans var. grubii MW-RSA852]
MNVFAACDFALNFISVFAGFERSAHDSRVLSHARTNNNFKMPPNTYLLDDAGYALAKDVLTPHRSVKYHSWEKNARPHTAEEEYNRHHASLRNCIERAFGVLKARFHILRNVPLRQDYRRQWRIVCACMVLHNMLNVYRNGTDEDDEELRETLPKEGERREQRGEREDDDEAPEGSESVLRVPEDMRVNVRNTPKSFGKCIRGPIQAEEGLGEALEGMKKRMSN